MLMRCISVCGCAVYICACICKSMHRCVHICTWQLWFKELLGASLDRVFAWTNGVICPTHGLLGICIYQSVLMFQYILPSTWSIWLIYLLIYAWLRMLYRYMHLLWNYIFIGILDKYYCLWDFISINYIWKTSLDYALHIACVVHVDAVCFRVWMYSVYMYTHMQINA